MPRRDRSRHLRREHWSGRDGARRDGASDLSRLGDRRDHADRSRHDRAEEVSCERLIAPLSYPVDDRDRAYKPARQPGVKPGRRSTVQSFLSCREANERAARSGTRRIKIRVVIPDPRAVEVPLGAPAIAHLRGGIFRPPDLVIRPAVVPESVGRPLRGRSISILSQDRARDSRSHECDNAECSNVH